MDQAVMLHEETIGLGLEASGTLRRDLAPAALVEMAVRAGEGSLVADGALATTTGPHTGRSPKDRFVVDRPSIRAAIDWGNVNQPLDAARLDRLWAKARAHVRGRDLHVQDLFAGADPSYRLRVRVITETAWHSLFARNMFLVPQADELRGFEPDFTVVQLPSLRAEPAIHGTRSQAAIVVDLERRTVLICGTRYAGEAKKSIFTVLNYLLPEEGVLPMHCSANLDEDG
ncbi:MAG: phosphoenolpyruvate carboxykinase (ATP), partial [Geminicoccaceae bacterium]